MYCNDKTNSKTFLNIEHKKNKVRDVDFTVIRHLSNAKRQQRNMEIYKGKHGLLSWVFIKQLIFDELTDKLTCMAKLIESINDVWQFYSVWT